MVDVSSEPFVKWDYSFDVEKCSGLGKKISKYENYWRTSVYNVIIDTTLQKNPKPTQQLWFIKWHYLENILKQQYFCFWKPLKYNF